MMFPVKKILSPTDFSKPSQYGLNAAIEMATQYEAELLLVHVIASIPFIAGTYSMSGARSVQMVEAMQEEASNQMEKLVASTIPDHLRCDARVIQGQPAEAIVRLAKEEDVGLIVIATHGYSGFNRFLFGSVAERVVRTAHCPVLTIRPSESQ
ncbi:MAG: universal stress protein [Desulfobacteraceae bacterium]|nr:MAG: universal stress protein [Desulfobacteraceae bacterium]